ncbi:MAG: helix-turn-helix domain-containing protein [Thermaerobacter sp.]|nr:helix-turn-helix domain-containing protein [Thermaerobacter sp.]
MHAEISPALKRLAAARRQQGLSQAELGRRIGRSRSFVSAVEQEKVLPSLPMYVAMCRVLAVPWNLDPDPAQGLSGPRLEPVKLRDVRLDRLPELVEREVRAVILPTAWSLQLSDGYPYSDAPVMTRQVTVDESRITLDYNVAVVEIHCASPTDLPARDRLDSLAHRIEVLLDNFQVVSFSQTVGILYDTAARLSAELDPAPLLQITVERAREFLAADLAYVTLMDTARQSVRMEVACGHRHPGFLEIVLPLGVGLGGWVARNQVPLTVRDYLNDNTISHDPATDALVRDEGIRAILGVPLVVRGSTLGVLFSAKREPAQFTAQDTAVLSSLADFAALALLNAESYTRALRVAESCQRAQEEAEQRHEACAAALELEHRLMALLARDGNLADAIEAVAAALEIELLYLSQGDTVLAHSSGWNIPGVAIGETLPWSWFTRHGWDRLRSQAAISQSACAQEGAGIVPLLRQAEVVGFLLARHPAPGDLPAPILEKLSPLAAIFTMHRIGEQALVEAGRRLHREFFDELLAHSVPPIEVVRRHGLQAWPALKFPHRAFVLQIVSSSDPHGFESMPQVYHVAASACPDDLLSIYGTRLVGLTSSTAPTRFQEMALRIQRQALSPSAAIRLVAGPVGNDLQTDRETLLNAFQVLDQFGASLRETVTWLEHVTPLLSLFGQAGLADLQQLVRQYLHPLLERDAWWLDTLHAYLAHNQNQAQTARALSVHPNTLRYRIEKIRELLGDALDDPVRRLLVEISVVAWKTLSVTP